MRARIRALERKLARQIAEIKVEPIVEQIVEEWPDPEDAETELADSPGTVEDPPRRKAPAPDTLVILDRLRDARIFLPTAIHAIAYLDQCWRDRKKPRANHILNRLLPWLCPSPIPYGYRT